MDGQAAELATKVERKRTFKHLLYARLVTVVVLITTAWAGVVPLPKPCQLL